MKSILNFERLTILEHREVRLVQGQEMQVRRELRHQPHQRLVDGRVGSAIPPWQLALLGR